MPFAPGIALAILATFRWADAQWVTEINKNDSVVYGICQRTKSNSGPFYRPPPPLDGLLNSSKWAEPTMIARAKYADSGNKPRFIFFHCNDEWTLDSPRPMKYATALACFRRLFKLWGFDEKFALHIPRAVLPTWSAQIGWRKEDLSSIGRMGPSSEMPFSV